MEAIYPPTPLVKWLQIVRDVCSTEVLRNFLLDESSSSDLGVLTSKAHTQHSVLGEVDVQILRTDRFTTLFRGCWVFIPAFCYQNYSALQLIQEQDLQGTSKGDIDPCKKALYPCEAPSSQFSFSRVIRDENTGCLVSLGIDDKGKAKIMAITMDYETRTRQRCYIILERDVLERGNIEEMRKCVDYYMHFTEKLVCKQCSVVVGSECSCPSPRNTRPLHPLDLETVTRNFSNCCGAYSGRHTDLIAYGGSETIFSQNFVVGNFSGGAPPGTLERLMSWVISNCLAKYFSKVSVPKASFSMELVTRAHRAIAEYLPLINTAAPRTLSGFNNTISDVEPLPLMGRSGPQLAIMDAISSSPSGPSNSDVFVDERAVVNGESTSGTRSGLTCILDASSPISGVLFENRNGIGNEQGGQVKGNDDGMEVGLSVTSTGVPTNGTKEMEYMDEMIDPTFNLRRGRAPGILKLPLTIRPMGIHERIEEEGQGLAVDNSSEAKARRRKIRNRESAARSNLKRRNGLAALKKNLSENKQRVEILKEKYEEVKETNKRLRSQIQGVRLQG